VREEAPADYPQLGYRGNGGHCDNTALGKPVRAFLGSAQLCDVTRAWVWRTYQDEESGRKADWRRWWFCRAGDSVMLFFDSQGQKTLAVITAARSNAAVSIAKGRP